jgi:hypothetical protein
VPSQVWPCIGSTHVFLSAYWLGLLEWRELSPSAAAAAAGVSCFQLEELIFGAPLSGGEEKMGFAVRPANLHCALAPPTGAYGCSFGGAGIAGARGSLRSFKTDALCHQDEVLLMITCSSAAGIAAFLWLN